MDDQQPQSDPQADQQGDPSAQPKAPEQYGGDPNNKVEQFFMSRFKSLDPKDRAIIGNSMTPQVAQAWYTAFPELQKILMYAVHKASITNHDQMQAAAGQNQGDSSQSTPGGPPQAPQAPNQLQPQDVGSALGFASGGLMSNAGMKKNIGYVNKQIPTNSLARGGMPLALPHVGAPGGLPAEAKFNSRVYNNPKYADGGLIGCNPYGQGGMMMPNNANAISNKSILGYADGGGIGAPTPPQQANNNAPEQPMTSGDPATDQAIQNQKVAEQVVPSEGTADGVPAKLSKGEYVMDAASVMYFGVGKLQQMQEKAHADLAKHLNKQQIQQAQQDDGSGGGPQQQPGQPQPQQQNQAQQQAPQGLGMPQQMPPQAAPQPDPSQQRIQQTATPPQAPAPQNPMSLMSRPPGNSPLG